GWNVVQWDKGCVEDGVADWDYLHRSIWYPPNGPYFYWEVRAGQAWRDPRISTNPSSGLVNTMGRASLKSSHPGGLNILLRDRSVRFLQENIELTIYKNWADRADGNVLGNF